jgi:hypothetical protein
LHEAVLDWRLQAAAEWRWYKRGERAIGRENER